MLYLAEFHGGWIAAAGVVGLLMGWVGVVQRGGGLSKRGLQLTAVILALAVACAFARIVPGRFGYWLDLGLMMFAVYILGCAIGAWLRELLVKDHRSMPNP
jgi:peptidoglycan biosynthesis protein MviN/MurJ (putative lipid II flippase)